MKKHLASRRDSMVICATCGRKVLRQMRAQKYCSPRCRELSRKRSRKAHLGPDTGAPATPTKKQRKTNDLQRTESRSHLIAFIKWSEFIEGRPWERVVSPHGVVCYVTRVRPPYVDRTRAAPIILPEGKASMQPPLNRTVLPPASATFRDASATGLSASPSA